MKFKEIDMRRIKKHFGFKGGSIRYHNKHRDGSGNFGTNFTKGEWNNGNIDKPSNYENWDLSGDYNSSGELYDLTFGEAYHNYSRINLSIIKNMDDLIKVMTTIMIDTKKLRSMGVK